MSGRLLNHPSPAAASNRARHDGSPAGAPWARASPDAKLSIKAAVARHQPTLGDDMLDPPSVNAQWREETGQLGRTPAPARLPGCRPAPGGCLSGIHETRGMRIGPFRGENLWSRPRGRQTDKRPAGAENPRGVTKWAPRESPTGRRRTACPPLDFARDALSLVEGRPAERSSEGNGPTLPLGVPPLLDGPPPGVVHRTEPWTALPGFVTPKAAGSSRSRPAGRGQR